MGSLVVFFAIVLISLGSISDNKTVAWPSRIMALFILLVFLGGCASVETSSRRIGDDVGSVVATVPDAVGAVAGAAIFGGSVSMVPAPEDYLAESVSREGRVIYNESRRAVQRTVSDVFRPK